MRLLIAFFSVAVLLNFADVSADVPKKEDIPKFIVTLKSAAPSKTRVQAAEDIGHRGAIRASDVDDAIDLLVGLLKNDKDAEVRRACAKALGDIGSKPEKCVEALKDALNDPNVNVKVAALNALGQYGRDAKSAVPLIKDFFVKKDAKKANKDDKKNLSKEEKKAMQNETMLNQAAKGAYKAIDPTGKGQ